MSALYRNKHKKTYKAVKQDDLSRRILAACLSASFASQPLTAGREHHRFQRDEL